MNDRGFDLQRFAEGDASEGTAADSPADVAGQDAPESAPAGAGTPPTVEEGLPAGDFGLRVDPVTGARSLVALGAAEEGAAQESENPAAALPQEVPAAPAAYTANELLAAMTTGRVDESRIPEDLRAPYVAIRQQQQIATLMAQTQQMQMRAAQTNVPQPTQEVQPPQGDVYRRIQEAAEAKAMHDLGLTREQLSDLSYSDDDADRKRAEDYRVAVQMNVNVIAREVDAYQKALLQQQAEAQAFSAEFLPKMQQVQRSEPNFNQIDLMMETFYQQLPYHEAVRVAEAIQRYQNGTSTRADIPVLEDYYNKTRAAFYAKQTGLSPSPAPAAKAAPPRVEGAGKVAASAPEQVDWRAMRTMGMRERSAFLRAHLP
jgi:hypothetical protein